MPTHPEAADVPENRGREEQTRVTRALRLAVREALLRHKRLGNPIVVYRDGRIVQVPPDEIEVPEE